MICLFMWLDEAAGVIYAQVIMVTRKTRMGPLTPRSARLHVGLVRKGCG